jgi:hypothetical protein
MEPIELSPDSYFRNIEGLFEKIDGHIDAVLEHATITSVRLVTNADKTVLRETQRSFTFDARAHCGHDHRESAVTGGSPRFFLRRLAAIAAKDPR